MNSLVRVFSNFKDFYNDINAATLTGAIDVIVVEQPDGEFQCSPFHVRFGKLGVLRSREKVVDIEINGAPVDIQMKLGDSGEAFFVEECPDDESEELDENLATSPIPKSYFPQDKTNESLASAHNDSSVDKTIASDDIQIPLPLPRRNSIDFSKDAPKEADAEGTKFENQVSDYSHRRHTDDTLERRNLSEKLKEYTTQKIRQEWAEHEEVFQFDPVEREKDCGNSAQVDHSQQQAEAEVPAVMPQSASVQQPEDKETLNNGAGAVHHNASVKDADSSLKTKTKKRRKKSQMKKKNSQRKNSSSSSVGSGSNLIGPNADANTGSGDGIAPPATSANVSSAVANASANAVPGSEETDALSVTISNATNSSSNDESTPKSGEQVSAALVTANADDDSPISESCPTLPHTSSVQRIHDLDIHFFSDTEITANISGGSGGSGRNAGGRPSTPIQSDSELETTLREKHHVSDASANAASWKWGELPTPDKPKSGAHSPDANQAERQSMLSNMFSFMKKANKIRKEANEAGDIYLSDLDAGSMDPEMAALYFPNPMPVKASTTAAVTHSGEEDRESGNGTSLPHSPSSLEGQKSLDSDFDDGKQQDSKYLDFVAMSLCGMGESGDPSDEEFNRNLISYPDVCKSPSLFSSPNLVVRLNGKYYTWTAACPIVMTIITFQKPLTNEAIAQLTAHTKAVRMGKGANGAEEDNVAIQINAENVGQTKRSWWYWRRSQGNAPNSVTAADAKSLKLDAKADEKDGDQNAVGTQTSRPDTPDASERTLSKTDESTMNAENTSAMVDNMEELSNFSNKSDEHKERYKKSLRLSSPAIKKLNLKEGSNLIEFSVTTAYQGTTRCKCYLFRWKHNDKVVISDIDGTITKSDVLGHILPMVGKDWAQLGVAQLFSKIEQNGYKLLYLSARAIGQSRVTREYLRSIRQGNVMLPDGPLLLNPTSLISAFHREVIEKKPEQFKIACLTDIRDLFPNKDPFYAGYGNRINDVWAYRAVGIPIMRIFTINTKGELKHELTQTFQSSYCSMTYIVDQLFPPIRYDDTAIEFSNFNYWRDPIPDVDLEIEEVMASSDSPEADATSTKSLRPIPEK